jgi:hypothetical protein
LLTRGDLFAGERIADNDRVIRRYVSVLIGAAVGIAGLVLVNAQTASVASDPIARAIADFASAFAGETSTDSLWTDAKGAIETNLKDAQSAIAAGRRWFALERLSQARQSFVATHFALQHPDERKDLAAFEREWTRFGARLGSAAPTPASLETVRPAALRALAEVALPQVRMNYDAGLEYGRNTQPEYGLYYVGVADAQQQFVALARTLTSPSTDGRQIPPLRSMATEIAVVQRDLLALYQPPASVDRHGEFIVASSALKEARQYDALGLRHAALLRFLQGAQRTAMLHVPPNGEPAAVANQMKALRVRLEGGSADHSIGLLMLERAEAAFDTGTSVGKQTAEAIVIEVMPRYFAAMAPAPPSSNAGMSARPAVTVTLVRWPFT